MLSFAPPAEIEPVDGGAVAAAANPATAEAAAAAASSSYRFNPYCATFAPSFGEDTITRERYFALRLGNVEEAADRDLGEIIEIEASDRREMRTAYQDWLFDVRYAARQRQKAIRADLEEQHRREAETDIWSKEASERLSDIYEVWHEDFRAIVERQQQRKLKSVRVELDHIRSAEHQQAVERWVEEQHYAVDLARRDESRARGVLENNEDDRFHALTLAFAAGSVERNETAARYRMCGDVAVVMHFLQQHALLERDADYERRRLELECSRRFTSLLEQAGREHTYAAWRTKLRTTGAPSAWTGEQLDPVPRRVGIGGL